ncbi:peptidase MA family protein [Leptospira bandrabouensis]|uniref:peptidase MA family protein n=1 Tax=Leptospira bandrabouensis TaxID=2484903 RepID=UPI001EE8F5CA|nr:peptidase MA family protein [Leptospira bandrabouensis]MCG6146163.1 peptidase MA family protein [Leptospira bandrabouensis]MCG6161422.1 peptidase MA family protein [Leptospira bandrabouensis]MCG6165750.1 peptidase MA family protein [Leptospira bandrabouensis]
MHLKQFVLIPLIFITSFTFNCNLLNSEKEKNDDLILLVGLYSLLGGSCFTGPDLWARDLVSQNSVCIPVEMVGEGSNVVVYKERSLSVNYDLAKFAKDFDTITYPKLITTFGTPSDVDGDGKVKILVMDIKDGATANSAYVAGYYDPVNFFPDNFFSPIRSNYAEVLYLDGKELIAALSRDPNAFASTAAHEFQHLLRYPRMRAVNQTDEIWINEGTSEVASDIAGYGPQTSRLDCYSGVTDSRCSDGINGVSLLDWDNNSSNVLKQYSFAYVFMRYLYDSSGTTEAERQTFFRNSVVGSGGIRANSTGSLMSLFRTSANFNSTLLGSQNSEVFFRIYALLVTQSFGLTNNLSSVEYVNADGATATTVDLSSASGNYLLANSTTLQRIITNPVTPTINRISIKQGATNFYTTSFGGTPAIPGSSRKNYGRVTSGGNKGVFFWADSPSGFNASAKYLPTSEEGTTLSAPKKPRSLKSVIEETPTSGPTPICGIEFINDSARTFESIPIK